MREDKIITILGLIIAMPLMMFAIYNNLWAEPSPPGVRPAFYVTINDH